MTGTPRPLRTGGQVLTRGRVVGAVVTVTAWPPAPVNSPGFLGQVILHQTLRTLVRFNSLVVLFWIMRQCWLKCRVGWIYLSSSFKWNAKLLKGLRIYRAACCWCAAQNTALGNSLEIRSFWGFPGGPVLGCLVPTAGATVQSLVREIRS